MSAYAKAGVIWSVLVFLVAASTGFLSTRSTVIFVVGVVGFVILFVCGIAAQTNVLILNSQEHIRVAAALLRLRQKKLNHDSSRWDAFDEALENSIRHARRFVGFDWWPRFHVSRLRDAFFGFKKPDRCPRNP